MYLWQISKNSTVKAVKQKMQRLSVHLSVVTFSGFVQSLSQYVCIHTTLLQIEESSWYTRNSSLNYLCLAVAHSPFLTLHLVRPSLQAYDSWIPLPPKEQIFIMQHSREKKASLPLIFDSCQTSFQNTRKNMDKCSCRK